MNIVRAFLFQHISSSITVCMVWEQCDIIHFSNNNSYRLIGQVDYDTEKHEIIKYDRG